MHRKRFLAALLLCAALVLCLAAPSFANPITGPLPPEVYIQYNGLDWAWASPVATEFHDQNQLFPPQFQDGWRYATEEEWANRPLAAAFLNDPNDPGSVRNAAAYWNSYYTHVDYYDGLAGDVLRLPTTLDDYPNCIFESWYVRGDVVNAVPVPAAGVAGLLGLGLLVVRKVARRKA